MKTLIDIFFVFLTAMTLMMGLFALMYQKDRALKNFGHLSEFWFSLGPNVVSWYFINDTNPLMASITLLGWVWPLRTFRNILKDQSGKDVFFRPYYIILAAGLIGTVALRASGFTFFFMIMPLSAALCTVGILQSLWAFRTTKEMSGLIFFSLSFWALVGAIPFWGNGSAYYAYGVGAELLILGGLVAMNMATSMDLLKKSYETAIDGRIKERDEKLLGNSKYSELGMMSAGIAHEINNPLAVIQARTTQLLRIYKDPNKQSELAEGLSQILYTSERINRTIQGVREFVHQDEKGPATEIRLKDLVEDVLAFCGQRMKNHGVSLRVYGLEDLSVVGNKIQLEQIILNLLNNSFDAIEYLGDKWIELTAQKTGDKTRIFVKDSGPGIPAEIADKIMEPFFSTKDIGKGTGLGLALAKGIAEKHGGVLNYVPSAAHTTFMLELPQNQMNSWNAYRSNH
jgi:signal transduction histidine kinase